MEEKENADRRVVGHWPLEIAKPVPTLLHVFLAVTYATAKLSCRAVKVLSTETMQRDKKFREAENSCRGASGISYVIFR